MSVKTPAWLFPVLILLTVLAVAGCEDDDDPTGPTTPTNLLLEFTFENFAAGQQVGSHTYAVSGITGVFDTGGNGVEVWADDATSVTRFFGTNAPVLTFTTTEPMNIARVEFVHEHNHNFSFTADGYEVQVEIDAGIDWSDLGTCFASTGTRGDEVEFVGPGELPAGTYAIRWSPVLPLPGGAADTNTDFFALDDVRIWTD